MAGNDFTLKLGADNTALLQGLQQAAQSLGGFTSAAKAAVAGLTAGFGIKALATDFMDYHTNLSNATQVMGYSVRNVEAIGGAMRRFGGDTSGALTSLDSLTSSLQQATWGAGPLLDVAQKYGVTFMKSNGQLMNAEELLGSLSSQLNTFDAQTKRAIASQLGLDAALLRVIDSGNYDSMIAQQRALGLSTEEDLKLATEMESAWLDLKDSFTQVARELSRTLVPHLTKLMRSLHSVMQSTAGFRGMLVDAFKKVLAVAEPLAVPIAGIAASFVALQTASKTLGLLQTALASLGPVLAKAFSPLKMASLLFGALLLVMEDIYVYSQGGDSVFGLLMKEFPLLEKGIGGVVNVIKQIAEALQWTWDFVTNLDWNDIKNIFANVFIRIKNMFIEFYNSIVTKINEVIARAKKMKVIGGAFEGISPLKTLKKEEYFDVKAYNKANELAAQRAQKNETNVKNETNITQYIQGKDAKAIADQSAEAIKVKALNMQNS